MPRPRKKRKYVRHHDRFADGYAFDLSPEIKKSIMIIMVTAVGGISLLSLFGTAGFLGEYINTGLGLMFGWGRFLVPFLLLGLSFLLFNEDKQWVRGYNYVGLFIFLAGFESLLHIFYGANAEIAAAAGKGGGYLGFFLVKIFIGLIGFWGAILLILCLLAISFVLMFNSTLAGLMGEESLIGKLLMPFKWTFGRFFNRGEYDDEGEEGSDEEEEEEMEDEEEAEYEEESGDEEFSSHAVGAATAVAAAESIVPRRSGVKVKIPVDLLSDKISRPSGGNIDSCKEVIKRTLENFDIPVEMGAVSVGPTVTQYTFKPADGVKLNRIVGLSNDLALALALHPIRIEAPIPGKALVGIEVPNKVKANVGLREILASKSFRKRTDNTMIALGKDVAGHSCMANLAKMPHLLVAGATGSGKSVCLNSIIVSLLYQNNPDDLKFIMVDPKRVELTVYNSIPYLLAPVITDVPKTINALKWCLNEMDRRFDLLAQAGKRNIDSYNSSSREKMPYIVFIIDELADLMVAAARDVEAAIIRLAQMARAVGIHLILATQRPSVDVITGLIKANVPARIAFSVSSSVDSRTILDVQGAEKLLSRGDMLFTTAELSKPKRIQGTYVDEKEIKKIVNYVKDIAGEAEYDDDIIGKQKVGGMAGAGFNSDNSDELYEEAKEIIINNGKASTSFLQRRLRIGYARAARLIDLLEESGIVGPANGSKPREILISQEQYAKVSEVAPSGMPLHNREESEFNSKNIFEDDEDEDEEEIVVDDNNEVEEENDDEEEVYSEETEASEEEVNEDEDVEEEDESDENTVEEEENDEDTEEEEESEESNDEEEVLIEDESDEDAESDEEEEDDKESNDEDMDKLFSR